MSVSRLAAMTKRRTSLADEASFQRSIIIGSTHFPWRGKQGDAIARRLPRGYAALSDQLRRTLLSAFLGIAEASSRTGSDRLARFRCARGEASEAAAALEAVQILRLGSDREVQAVMALLDRLCAMITRLAGLTHNRRGPLT